MFLGCLLSVSRSLEWIENFIPSPFFIVDKPSRKYHLYGQRAMSEDVSQEVKRVL